MVGRLEVVLRVSYTDFLTIKTKKKLYIGYVYTRVNITTERKIT